MITLTNHIIQQADMKNIPLDKILRVLDRPARTTHVSRYENQTRYIGEGIAVIVDTNAQRAITVYLDGIITPLRADQIARGEMIQRTH